MKLNYKDLQLKLATGHYTEVRGPKPSSPEYKKAAQGLDDRKMWSVI